MIVNKKFNILASDPALWKRYPVDARKVAQLYGLDILRKVLELPKFRRLEVLDLSGTTLVALVRSCRNNSKEENCKEELVHEKFFDMIVIASNLPLKSLDLSYNGFDRIYKIRSPAYQAHLNFLAKMVLNIQHVLLRATFTHNKEASLLKAFLEGVTVTSVLSSIDLEDCKLQHLPISSIVKLSCLSDVSLKGAYMREEQASALMKVMGEGSNMKKLDLGGEPLYDAVSRVDILEIVEPEIVAKALNSVEYLKYKDWGCRDLEPHVHLDVFFEEMGEKPTCLKKLDMDEINYIHVGPSVIAKALNKLEYLELKPNKGTGGVKKKQRKKQIVAILRLMAKQTNIVVLKIIYEDMLWLNPDNMSWLKPDLLARAVVQVEQVEIMCYMSRAQITAILYQLDNNSRTKRLSLGRNDVSVIPGWVLENAVEILRKNGGTAVVTQTRGVKYLSYSSSPETY